MSGVPIISTMGLMPRIISNGACSDGRRLHWVQDLVNRPRTHRLIESGRDIRHVGLGPSSALVAFGLGRARPSSSACGPYVRMKYFGNVASRCRKVIRTPAAPVATRPCLDWESTSQCSASLQMSADTSKGRVGVKKPAQHSVILRQPRPPGRVKGEERVLRVQHPVAELQQWSVVIHPGARL